MSEGWDFFLFFVLERANQFPAAQTAAGRPKHNGRFSTRGLDVLFLQPSVACHLLGPWTVCYEVFLVFCAKVPERSVHKTTSLSPFWGWLICKQRQREA